MRLQMYLSKDELAFVKTKPEGWVRELVQKEMGGGSKTQEKTLEKKYVNKSNPYICKSCGHLKVAGRCVWDECKLKGKLQ